MNYISALIYILSFSKLLSQYLYSKILYPREILQPLLSANFTFYIVFFALSISLFALSSIFFKKTTISNNKFYLFNSIFYFLQSTFFDNSILQSSVLFCIPQILLFINPKTRQSHKTVLYTNSIVAALLTASLVHNFIYNLSATSLIVWIFLIIFRLLALRSKFVYNPTHLILSTFLIFPPTIQSSLLILSVYIVSTIVTHKKIDISKVSVYYPYFWIAFLAYNPYLRFLPIDSVEEGIWFAWLSRLNNNQTIYLDFLSYHPPLIVTLLKAFTSIFGNSAQNLKLFFHLLQIVSLMGIYGIFQHLFKNNFGKYLLVATILLISSSPVKNNLEVRLLFPLLSIYFAYLSNIKDSYKHLLYSALTTIIAFLISTETAIFSTLSILTLTLTSKNPSKKYLIYLTPMLLVSALSFILNKEYFLAYYQQVLSYIKLFSGNYMNILLPEFEKTNLLKWNLLVINIKTKFIWYLTPILIVIPFFLIPIKRKANKMLQISNKHKFALTIAIFNILIFRSSIGRADFSHLLFTLLPTTIISLYLLLDKTRISKGIKLFIFSSFFILFTHNLPEYFLDYNLSKLQTFNIYPESVKAYDSKYYQQKVRSDLYDSDLNNLLNYIDSTDSHYTFTYPWFPEFYYLSNTVNPTKNDLPFSFIDTQSQQQTIEQLERHRGKVTIIIKDEANFGRLDTSYLPLLDNYLKNEYEIDKVFGKYQVHKLIPDKL